MTPLQKLEVRQSERRQRLNELGSLDKLDDALRSEVDALSAEYGDGERQYRALKIADEAEAEATTTEATEADPERAELRANCKVGNYIAARLEKRAVTGAEAELAAELGTSGIPMELFEPTPEMRAALEKRTISGAPSTVGVNMDVFRPAVFAPSVVPRLGVQMPRVPTGTYATGTVTGSLTGRSHVPGHDAAADAATITVTTVTPKRISARLELRAEDIEAVGQDNFESILRENLSLALSAELDHQGLNGAGATNDDRKDLNGLFVGLGSTPTPPTEITDFDAFVGEYALGVDGLWATTCKQVGIVVGVDTYQLAATTFRDTPADGGDGAMAFVDYAMGHYGALWTSKRMPDTATNIQQAILYRMGRSFEGGGPGIRTAVCPVWSEIQIDDRYTGSAKAERYLTFHVILGDVIIVQPDAYERVSFKVS